ncbi:hypothetical protein Bhyg_17472 [Pseudolycoriella hygida]|uniref:Uncharacterized protein n=1 Tax=Pseudolycoriella hygida TaxID=35572 RepID=A0A9Q0MK13_9DIPT|nr:hypothetical protein Bhyg_17472 [Pseudolycoriella hygida]
MQLEEDCFERRENAEKVMSLLKFIQKSEINLLEEDYGGHEDESIAYPFLDDDEGIAKKRKRKMSKIETDKFLMSSFSKEYKQVEDQVRKEMHSNGHYSSCTEDLGSFHFNEMTEEFVEDSLFLDEVKKLLSLSGLDALFAEREKEAVEKKKDGKVQIQDSTIDRKITLEDIMSSETLTIRK